MKNILIVDDSALMRSVLRDIISSDDRFSCKDYARNGEDALRLLERCDSFRHQYAKDERSGILTGILQEGP